GGSGFFSSPKRHFDHHTVCFFVAGWRPDPPNQMPGPGGWGGGADASFRPRPAATGSAKDGGGHPAVGVPLSAGGDGGGEEIFGRGPPGESGVPHVEAVGPGFFAFQRNGAHRFRIRPFLGGAAGGNDKPSPPMNRFGGPAQKR